MKTYKIKRLPNVPGTPTRTLIVKVSSGEVLDIKPRQRSWVVKMVKDMNDKTEDGLHWIKRYDNPSLYNAARPQYA